MHPFFQALTGSNIRPTSYDAEFLQQQGNEINLRHKSVDELGRTQYLDQAAPLRLIGNQTIEWAGQGRGSYTRDGYSQNGVAYSIISYILQTSATIPWHVYDLTSKDANRNIVTGQQLSNLLYRPNPTQSWAELKLALFGYLLTTGNAYLYANRLKNGANAGKASELWVLPASSVEVLGGGYMQEVTGYQVRRGDGKTDTYAAADVLHLKFWNPEDARYGLSPIAAGSKLVTAANSGLDVRVKQYQNNGPGGVLFLDEKDGDAGAPSATAVSQLSAKIKSFFSPRKAAYDIPFSGYKLGYLQLGLSPVDLQVLQALDADKNGIADLFHFPGHLLNGTNGSTFNNVSEASKSLYTKCVIPLETQLRDGINRWLGKDYQDKLWLDYDLSGIAELQEDKKVLAEWLHKCCWIKLKDKQRLLGVEVDEKLDFYVLEDHSILHEQPLTLQLTPSPRPATTSVQVAPEK